MQALAGGPGPVFREISEDRSVEQLNSELKDMESDLEALSELHHDFQVTVKRDGENLTTAEKKTQEASKAINYGTKSLSESQATKSIMGRIGFCVAVGFGAGFVAGAIIFPFVPLGAGVVTLFMTTLGGAASGGAVVALK